MSISVVRLDFDISQTCFWPQTPALALTRLILVLFIIALTWLILVLFIIFRFSLKSILRGPLYTLSHFIPNFMEIQNHIRIYIWKGLCEELWPLQNTRFSSKNTKCLYINNFYMCIQVWITNFCPLNTLNICFDAKMVPWTRKKYPRKTFQSIFTSLIQHILRNGSNFNPRDTTFLPFVDNNYPK